MFFYLSKIVGFFALPSNFLILLGILGLLLIPTRWSRTGRRLTAASILLVALFGLSPLGNALILPLEDRFPAWDATRGAPDGIVVLGGAVDELVSSARDDFELNEAAERMTATVALALRYPAARVVFSGGTGRIALMPQSVSEAAIAVKLFESLGIARQRITAEDRSRTTAENATFTKELVDPKPTERWLLVTSAHHMPRAMGVFRRAGFAVEPHPVDWRTRGREDLLRPFPNIAEGLRRTDVAVREWVGLVAYRVSGRSAELFPGPLPSGN
jgi:uncharacterized SAM-binding protein YcdF (DUF218 family)